MAAPGENLRINADRLWDSLMEMAKIGPGVAGGNNRQTLTDADGEGRRLFQAWCEAAGCTMGVDDTFIHIHPAGIRESQSALTHLNHQVFERLEVFIVYPRLGVFTHLLAHFRLSRSKGAPFGAS